MSVTNLDTHSVEGILDLCSDFDVCTFLEAFPEHEDAVNAVWTHRPEINVDDATLRDASEFIQAIRRRKKLKRLTFKRRRQYNSFSNLTTAIASNCSDLEVLNIPGLLLTPHDVSVLSSCRSLKRMNIKYDRNATELVEELVENNPHLEAISIHGSCTNNFFENLPETLKQITIVSILGLRDNSSFWNRVQTWKLEKLEINVNLTEDQILMLSTQTTLKYLSLHFEHIGNSLERLFHNNQSLEEVSLTSSKSTNGAFLKYLPPTVKCLKCLKGPWILYADAFVDYVRAWNLHSLTLFANYNIKFIIRILNAAPSLTNLTIDTVNILSDQNFRNFEKLAHLEFLCLENNPREQNNLWRSFLENCVNLQKLKIDAIFCDSDMCLAIAALPKLKEICLYCHNHIRVDFVSHLQKLSRSTSLTTVEIENFRQVTKRGILCLIRECRTFTKFVLNLRSNLNVTEEFLRNITQELKQQTDRRNILHIEIMALRIYGHIRSRYMHPMLNLEFIPLKDW